MGSACHRYPKARGNLRFHLAVGRKHRHHPAKLVQFVIGRHFRGKFGARRSDQFAGREQVAKRHVVTGQDTFERPGKNVRFRCREKYTPVATAKNFNQSVLLKQSQSFP